MNDIGYNHSHGGLLDNDFVVLQGDVDMIEAIQDCEILLQCQLLVPFEV